MYKKRELSQKEQQELIRRAKECDSSAFASIYEYYYEGIYNYVYHRVAKTSVTEDLTAEVFLKALESIDSYTFRGIPLGVWLFRIARNLVMDYFRGRPATEMPLEEGMSVIELGADAVFDGKLTQQQLAQALSSLTDDQQEVLILRFVDGFSPPDVAQVLGKSEGAIHSLQHRALGALTRVLEEFFPEINLTPP